MYILLAYKVENLNNCSAVWLTHIEFWQVDELPTNSEEGVKDKL